MKNFVLRGFVLLLSLNAKALVLVPTPVRNETAVTVRIIITRIVRCAGPDRSQEGPWVTEVILAPGQDGKLLLRGGAHELCSSGVKSLRIEMAPRAVADSQAPSILPLSLSDDFAKYWGVLSVQVDPRNHRFILRAKDPTR